MAFTNSKSLTNTSTTIFRDPQHAARMFVDDQFRLAPKQQFLFHVAFGINRATLKDASLLERHTNEINMLVKKVDLPNFTIKTETLNQYNRKRNIQTTHTYNPISITFHDDNMGLINKMWQNYYHYYYADSSSAKDVGAYNKNATKNFNTVRNTYGLDNQSKLAFFKYIKIYQLARHEYICYQLINPIFSSWNHNSVDYGGNGPRDFTAQVSYEAVAYTDGSISSGTPEGFAVEHYDKTPSPLTGQPSTSASPNFSNTATLPAAGIFGNLADTLNAYQNSAELSRTPATQPASINITQTVLPTVNGVQGVLFPVTSLAATTTPSSLINLG